MRIKTVLFLILFSGVLPSFGFEIKNLGPLAANLPKPTATLEKFDIKRISLRDITFTFDIGINNPYMFGLRLGGVDLDFSVQSNKVFHTTAANGFNINPKGKAITSFDITITYESILKLIKDYSSHDFLTCDIDGLIKIPIPNFIKGLPPSVNLPFKLSKQIPAIKPKISIVGFKVSMPTEVDVKASIEKSVLSTAKNLDPKKVQGMFNSLIAGQKVEKPVIKPEDIDLKFKVGFDIVLQNEAKTPLDFTSLKYNFLVNSNQLIQGLSSTIKKTGTTTLLSITNEFSSQNLTPGVLNAFKTGAGTFTLVGSTTLQLPQSILAHPLQVEFKEDGNFKLR